MLKEFSDFIYQLGNLFSLGKKKYKNFLLKLLHVVILQGMNVIDYSLVDFLNVCGNNLNRIVSLEI